jgi:hypothetical protein
MATPRAALMTTATMIATTWKRTMRVRRAAVCGR